MSHLARIFILLVATAVAQVAHADDAGMQERFDQKYATYLQADSQALLPLPQLEKPAWKKFQESRPLRKVYSEPDKFYNNKVYVFTLYQATDDGNYYLDAVGGFWGMDELIYGPLLERDLQ